MDVDWQRYLEYMNERGLNYLRNWVIFSTGDPHRGGVPALMPFARTGPGLARDGKPKFDLNQFNEEYFRRLAEQAAAAEKHGIYISVMLFEVYGFLGNREKFWQGNVFHGPNNVNGIELDTDGNGQGMEFFYSDDARVRTIQTQYVQKVVRTLQNCDNVFFEIANELHAPDWQLAMLRAVHEAEAGLTKRHLVYFSPGGRNVKGGWTLLPKKFLLDSSADVISVTRGWNKLYVGNPPVEEAGRPVFMDMDHVAAVQDGDNEWNNRPLMPWKAFTRGFHVCIYDFDYWKPTSRSDAWESTRRSCGATAKFAREVDLAAFQPRSELASSGYCLANPGVQYVVFQPEAGDVRVQGLTRGAKYQVEWLRIADAAVRSQTHWTAVETTANFDPPETPVVLHLKKVAD